MSPDAWQDGMFVIQTRYPQAVFSHETALYLLNLADREPTHYTVTLKAGTIPANGNIFRACARIFAVRQGRIGRCVLVAVRKVKPDAALR